MFMITKAERINGLLSKQVEHSIAERAMPHEGISRNALLNANNIQTTKLTVRQEKVIKKEYLYA